MWVFKIKGETYYVHRAEFNHVSFQTKETPDNPSTKGSLKLKGFYSQRMEGGQIVGTVYGELPAEG